MPQSGFWKKAMGISALMRNWMEFDLFQIFQNCNGSSRSYSVFWLAHMIFPKPKDDNVIVTTPAAGVLQNPTVLPRVFGNAQTTNQSGLKRLLRSLQSFFIFQKIPQVQ